MFVSFSEIIENRIVTFEITELIDKKIEISLRNKHSFLILSIENDLVILAQLSTNHKFNYDKVFYQNQCCLKKDMYLVDNYKYVINKNVLEKCKNRCRKENCKINKRQHFQQFNKMYFKTILNRMNNKKIIRIKSIVYY